MIGNPTEKPVTCIGCGGTIAQGFMTNGRITIICPKCKVSNIIEAKHKPEGHAAIGYPGYDSRGRSKEVRVKF